MNVNENEEDCTKINNIVRVYMNKNLELINEFLTEFEKLNDVDDGARLTDIFTFLFSVRHILNYKIDKLTVEEVPKYEDISGGDKIDGLFQLNEYIKKIVYKICEIN